MGNRRQSEIGGLTGKLLKYEDVLSVVAQEAAQ